VSLDDDAPREPSRIILPGGGKPGGLVGPDGRPLGATFEAPADAAPGGEPAGPTHPRLRALELQEAREGGRAFVVLIDPTGVAKEALAVSAEAMPILMLLDGSVALDDLVALVDRETGDPRAGQGVRALVDQLDRHLYLESPRYEAARDALRAEYAAQPSRPAALAGLSYPEDANELTAFLDAFDATARTDIERGTTGTEAGAQAVAPLGAQAPHALAAPHIDLRRGGATIARAYLELDSGPNGRRPDTELPDVVFLFGTGHSLVEQPFAITTKSYETPLGPVATDEPIVRGIIDACGAWITDDELAHRDEHSIEFQAVELRHRLGARKFTMVPLLCGGFHGFVRFEKRPAEDERVEALVQALLAAAASVEAQGRRALFLAGVDLSHVGTRFGDAVDLDTATLTEIETKDKAAITAALTGSAEAWFDAVAAHGDSTRICGFAPTYMMLRTARPAAGRLLAYERSLEEGGSVVTYASVAWP